MIPVSAPHSVGCLEATRLSDQNRALLSYVFTALRPESHQDPHLYLNDEVAALTKQIEANDPNFVRCLRPIRETGSEPYRVVGNLPIDTGLPPPPADGKRPIAKKTWWSEATLLLIAKLLELQVLAYEQENQGTLVQEIAPNPVKANLLASYGMVPLSWHCDHAVLDREYRPDYLFLLCLRNDDRVPTLIAPIDEILEQISPEVAATLRQPKFRIESPDSTPVWGGMKVISRWRSLITTNLKGENEIATGALCAIRCLDQEAEQARQILIATANHIAKAIALGPGELLVFANHRVMHARPQVQGPRWFQRIFCRESLDALQKACGTPSGNIFNYEYLITANSRKFGQ